MSDFRVKFDEARQRLPLKRLMEQRGKGAANGNWKSFPCPYCQKKGASVFANSKGGGDLFKCFNTGCSSGTAGEKSSWDEIGFLAHELGINRSEATKVYFQEAGVWQERESHAPSVLPGQRARKKKFPAGEPPANDLPPTTSPPQISSAAEGSSPDTIAGLLQGKESRLGADGAAVHGSQPVAADLNAAPPDASSGVSAASLSPSVDKTPGAPAEIGPVPTGNEASSTGDVLSSKPEQPMAKSEQLRLIEDIEKFFNYLALVEKRRFVFLDLEGAAGYKRGKELIEAMGEWKLIVPVTGGLADGEYAIEPDWKLKVERVQNPAKANIGTGSGVAPDNIIALPPVKPPKPPKEELPPGPPPLSALRWFYRRLQLLDADRAALWLKRGLTAKTCAALGYRSNPKTNKEILEEMAKVFPPAVLVDCGLWVEGSKPTDKPKPNPQFYGMSLREKRDDKGKKVKDEDGKVITECVWNNPLLIPYFDAEGELIHLRPHKGMMRDKPPRFYAARPGKEFLESRTGTVAPAPGFAIVTEGEFKAGALWQVLNGEALVGSLPGISMAKLLFGDIEEWLEAANVRRAVIGYDNEEKSDPNLPGYKTKEYDRFDAEVWGRYLARQLAKEGYDAKVARIPNEWRDANGKADWDGRLAQLVHGAASPTGELLADDQANEETWKRVSPVAREQFLEVINQAGVVNELWQMGFFDSQAERIIKNKLEKISYEAKLPIGGEAEGTIARRLQRLCAKTKGNDDRLNGKARGFLMMLATAYRDTNGGYYIFKQLGDQKQSEWQTKLAKAADNGDTEVKRACELALKGLPTRVSDFYMKAHYVLNRLNGTRCRLVTLHNMHGVNTDLLSLPSAPFSQPSKFREWLLDNITGATWRAGERELNDLQADIARDVAFKDVAEVAIRGYHADSKLWFFKDVTFTPDGKELFSDRNGIIWFDGRAYKLVDTDHEKQTFRHKEPLMHPETKILKSECSELFRELVDKMFDTVGGYDGWLALGVVLSCAAGPEIYEAFNGFPGLWLHGETGQGKTSVAIWLMRIWGYSIKQGMALKDSTKVGLSIVLQQYSNLPVFLEEFQPTAEEWQIEKMKNIFDRVSGSKKTFDEGDRKILAGAIVTGIATCRDAQVRNRYAHVQVASANRLANHYNWFQENSSRFYLLGRFLMRHRKEFAAAVIAAMREWMVSDEMKKIDERARVVHGASFAAMTVMNQMLKVYEGNAIGEFREFVARHSSEAVKQSHEQVNVNLFWTELLNALSENEFGDTPGERIMYFKARVTPRPAPSDLSPAQLKIGAEDPRKVWEPMLLYFRPGPVIDIIRRWKRQQGRDLPLDQSDLRAQMKTRGYWVEPGELGTAKPEDNVHRMKFGHGSRTPVSCWCINLEKHEMGRRKISDGEFQSSMLRDGQEGIFIQSDEWVDPRKGDLYALLDSLKSQKQQEAAD